jgi:hypothetical protein
VRVQYGHAVAILYVLADEIEQQRRFAAAGDTDDMGVSDALLGREADRSGIASFTFIFRVSSSWRVSQSFFIFKILALK